MICSTLGSSWRPGCLRGFLNGSFNCARSLSASTSALLDPGLQFQEFQLRVREFFSWLTSVESRALREVKLTLNWELQLPKNNVYLKAFFTFFAEL